MSLKKIVFGLAMMVAVVVAASIISSILKYVFIVLGIVFISLWMFSK